MTHDWNRSLREQWEFRAHRPPGGVRVTDLAPAAMATTVAALT